MPPTGKIYDYLVIGGGSGGNGDCAFILDAQLLRRMAV